MPRKLTHADAARLLALAAAYDKRKSSATDDAAWADALYDLDPDDLDEHYRKRTTLGVSILPHDVAQAVMHFASDARSGKSTGNVLNVDGGVPAAYPR